MRKKVILVKPPEQSFFNFGTFSLGVLGAAIRHLAEVSIIDATEMSVSEAVANTSSQQPDLIGVTVMGLQSIHSAAEFIKNLQGKIGGFGDRTKKNLIIAGGHGATMLPNIFLEAGADGVVIGEGELTFQKIIKDGISQGMAGLACLNDATVVSGPPRPLIAPLDFLDTPARDLMPPPPNGVHLMETSRGCPHNCAFCETTRFHGRRWRPFSPERVVREVKRLVDDFDAWIIHIADDNFTASPDRVKKICARLQDIDLPAFFMLSARADDLVADPDLLPMMAASQMRRITVGIESLDHDVARAAGKPIPATVYRQAFSRMRELGIFSIASLIVGLPGETRTARESAVELAVEVGPDSAHFLPFQPQPGIPMGADRNGYDPAPADILDAKRFSQAFFQHPTVQSRLKAMARKDGVQGLLARFSLENPMHKEGPTGL